MPRHAEASRLADVQRRLWRLITAPEGVAPVLAEDGDPRGRNLEVWLTGDRALGAVRRLDVYANAYFLRIHDCLKQDYGALSAALGAEAFHDLATAYLLAHPPRHPSLRFAGVALANFLAADPAAAPFRRRWPWAADLARLEWALVDAFDAADEPSLQREDLARLPVDRWPALRLRFHPSLRLLRLSWPVQVLRGAWERGEPLPPVEAAAATVGVWRCGERVVFRTVPPLEATLLASACAGVGFGALCERAAEDLGEDAAPGYAAERVAQWVADELLVHPLDSGESRASTA